MRTYRVTPTATNRPYTEVQADGYVLKPNGALEFSTEEDVVMVFGPYTWFKLEKL